MYLIRLMKSFFLDAKSMRGIRSCVETIERKHKRVVSALLSADKAVLTVCLTSVTW